MMINNEMIFTKDLPNKKINVVRDFAAPLADVWAAWTEPELLDQWWAPRPYRAETKIMDFREGGMWIYAMIGPQGDSTLCKELFKTIAVQDRITNAVSFCDEEYKDNPDFPVMYWNKGFEAKGDATTVNIEITFDSEADLQTIISMGFEEGFKMGMGNLDELLAK
ncbi:SRPBCC domain-containing protein [Mucilaginibacter sp. ZT4R22]|uniref:SRPBCC domain-containing protein n=1 Tax=Mucilaginibacter pankratovii TaxID=2772110 RepID=A0ABR7WT91_9SPHI|nr:SRPBCC domain-containing protein [Mucilaginibacter pankratovii]MBD1365525.1 SRPBCC domain-containing protein [Mucilaginibacter pankratovii]